jgi:hypothetical protein
MNDRPGIRVRPPLRALLAIPLLAYAGGCATTPGPAADALPGCYYFEQDAAAQALQLPWGVRLTADSLTGWPAIQQRPDVRRAVTLTGTDATATYPFGYWRPLAGDSVEIGYPAGGGLLLRLAIEADGLAGTARPVGDVVAQPGIVEDAALQRVRLTRARCPDER